MQRIGGPFGQPRSNDPLKNRTQNPIKKKRPIAGRRTEDAISGGVMQYTEHESPRLGNGRINYGEPQSGKRGLA